MVLLGLHWLQVLLAPPEAGGSELLGCVVEAQITSASRWSVKGELLRVIFSPAWQQQQQQQQEPQQQSSSVAMSTAAVPAAARWLMQAHLPRLPPRHVCYACPSMLCHLLPHLLTLKSSLCALLCRDGKAPSAPGLYVDCCGGAGSPACSCEGSHGAEPGMSQCSSGAQLGGTAGGADESANRDADAQAATGGGAELACGDSCTCVAEASAETCGSGAHPSPESSMASLPHVSSMSSLGLMWSSVAQPPGPSTSRLEALLVWGVVAGLLGILLSAVLSLAQGPVYSAL